MTAVEGNKSAKKTTSAATSGASEAAEERDKENDDQNRADQSDAKTSDVSLHAIPP